MRLSWVSARSVAGHSELTQLHEWLELRICRPDSELGRRGAICPYVAPALRLDRVWYVLVPGPRTLGELTDIVREVRTEFLRRGCYGPPPLPAVVIVLPGDGTVAAAALVARVQRELKTEFVELGLMIGEFFPDYQAPGIRNAAFRPLTAPSPLVVIRPMVRGDLIFLVDQPEWVAHYERLFSADRRELR